MTQDTISYRGYHVRPRPPGSARAMLEPMPDYWRNTLARAEAAIAQPFVGVTTDGAVPPDLFPLQSTGIPTRPIVDAARAFVELLSPAQQALTIYPLESQEWRRWSNWEQYPLRHGLSMEEMRPNQLQAALELLRASLSVRGFTTARNVMKLNEVLREITGLDESLGEWLYFITIFGTPSLDSPWGWQIDGHHLNISYLVLGDQVVMTPTFMGAEPTQADRGPSAGLREFEVQERNGLELIRALSPAQRAKAIIFPSMISTDLPPERYTPNDGRQQAVALKDNVVIPYEGLPAQDMTKGQQQLLMSLLQSYAGWLRPGHDQIWLEQLRAHLDATHFTWIGGFGDDDVFYYKIHSPVILIDFDMHKGVFLDNAEPEKFHVHIMVRPPNGNDYGKDLLRQHLEQFHHEPV
jgi:hypothetical protein